MHGSAAPDSLTCGPCDPVDLPDACPQNSDLLNPESQLDRRIDLVFVSGSVGKKVKANVLNNSPLNKTQNDSYAMSLLTTLVFLLNSEKQARTTRSPRNALGDV